jgi:hypothetical protein
LPPLIEIFYQYYKIGNPASFSNLSLRVIQKLKRSTSKDEAKKEKREKLIVMEHQQYIDVMKRIKGKSSRKLLS